MGKNEATRRASRPQTFMIIFFLCSLLLQCQNAGAGAMKRAKA